MNNHEGKSGCELEKYQKKLSPLRVIGNMDFSPDHRDVSYFFNAKFALNVGMKQHTRYIMEFLDTHKK